MYTVKIRFNTEHAKSGVSNGLLWRVLIFGNVPEKPNEYTEHLASHVKFTRGCYTTSEEIAPGVVKQHVSADTSQYPSFEEGPTPAEPNNIRTITIF